MTRYTPLRQFKAAVAKHERPQGLLTKATVTTVTALEDRRALFTVSTASVDRDRDRVLQDGWDLAAYLQNPIVLWGHNSGFLPIGKTTRIGVEEGVLRAEVEFVPADMPEVGPLAEAIHRMTRTGFLSATSVGFRPKAYTVAKDRMDEDDWFPPLDFTEHELLEWSIVTIPANAEALIDPSSRDLPAEPAAAAAAAAAADAERQTAIRAARRAARLAAYT